MKLFPTLLSTTLGLALAAAGLTAAPAAWACGGSGNTAEIEDQIQQGYYLDRQGEYTEAIDTFKKVLAAHPDNRKAHYFLANTYWRDNDFIGAGREWSAVLHMNPSDRIGREARDWLAKNERYIKGGATVQTVSGGLAGYADGAMSTARYNNPQGMVLSPTGNLYIADTGNHRIRRITPDGTVLTVAGTGEEGFADGAARTARLQDPHGLALDPVGNLYFCDGARVRFVTPNGQVGTLTGNGERGWIDGNAQQARLWAPRALTVDDQGVIYVADGGSAIRQILPNGDVHLVAGGARDGFADGAGEAAKFRNITSIKWTKEKVIMVLDSGNNRLRALNLAGVVKSLPGCPQNGYVDGPMANAHFRKLSGMAVDRNGNLILADAGNFAIRRVNAKLEVETIAGGTGAGTADGRGFAAHFRSPEDIAVWNNTVFVLDRELNGIRRITLGAKDL